MAIKFFVSFTPFNLFICFKKEDVNKNDLIVITGDIMDNPYTISGSAIKLAKYLYVNLTEFCPVINILGNHDYKTNTDTITPIVKEHLTTKNDIYFLLNNKNCLFYLKKSRSIYSGNISFLFGINIFLQQFMFYCLSINSISKLI